MHFASHIPSAAWVLFLSWFIGVSTCEQSVFGQERFLVDKSHVVGSLQGPRGELLGTCFCIDDRGYLATSFSNVVQSDDAYVVFVGGFTFKIAGFVGASRGKDVVILAMVRPPKSEGKKFEFAPCNSNEPFEIGQAYAPWGGPRSEVVSSIVPLPRLMRRLNGAEMIIGYNAGRYSEIGASEFPGAAPETRWLIFDTGRDRSCNGGPVFNRQGQIVAMQSNCLAPAMPLVQAIEIQHIVELVPKQTTKPKALKLLEKWTDPLPASIQPTAVDSKEDVEPQSLAGDLLHGLSLAHRVDDWSHRISMMENMETDRGGIEQELEGLKEAMAAIELEIKTVVPEEAYTDYEIEVSYKDKYETREEEGSDGKKKKVQVKVGKERVETKVPVTKMRYSPRQLEIVTPLENQRDSIYLQARVAKHHLSYLDDFLPSFMSHVGSSISKELFYLADPLSLRPSHEHRDLERSLTKIVDHGNASGDLHIARAMARMKLGDFEGADADLEQALEFELQFFWIVSALRLKIDALRNDSSSGTAKLGEILRESPTDPRLWVIAAGFDIDAKKWLNALTKLKRARELDPRQIEIQYAMAWVHQAQEGTSNKGLMELPTELIHRTGGRDWVPYTMLAASYARTKNTEKAKEMMDAAMRVVPLESVETCKVWNDRIQRGEGLVLPWSVE